MAEIDIDAANKIRVAMGLKPLPAAGEGPVFKSKDGDSGEEPASTIDTREAAAGDNWRKLHEDAAAKAKRQAQKEAIKKARDAAMRDAKYAGRTLGEAEEDLDTRSWLVQQKKRQKKIEKEQKLQEEREAQRKKAEYTARDLAGVKVGHELDQFDAGSEQVLTLKDAVIGDESEEDELENLELRAKEQLEKRLESKKRKPVYNPNDIDESGPKSLLAQYDEGLGVTKTSAFTLDGKGSTLELAQSAAVEEEYRAKGVLINLELFREEKQPVSDYVDPSEIKIRKPKKKKERKTRKREVDDDDIPPLPSVAPSADTMEVDSGAGSAVTGKNRTLDESNIIDDEDLQAMLAQQRRGALKKRKRMRPEDLAKQLKEEELNAMDVTESVEEPGLVLDETSEFVANLRRPEDEDERPRRKSAQPPEKARHRTDSADAEGDVDMEQSYAAVEEAAERNKSGETTAVVAPDLPHTGLEEESSLNQGLGATVAMLQQRGLLHAHDGSDLNSSFREQQKFLAERRQREEDAERKARMQRERDRTSGRLERMSAREREEYARQSNVHREQQESRELTNMFNRDYRPQVELKYVDEFGRHMSQKEAFKHLSHQFHGKGSGKQKTEKRLKKIEEEKKREAMSLLDSSQHVVSTAMGDKAKRTQQAGVRLQ
ncbi:hypothetical protein EJ06DRAFT_18059 [Trichodelitschia bisporula]|uniref:SART-1 protein n=1 Tax=Trichodelitschia bisporula TaxID=703511 RepID=A0A6G1IAM0_9PEZI|nr:hypothetical protein EJ06DRAFT_18059 [Trichodelitschia bisporula]